MKKDNEEKVYTTEDGADVICIEKKSGPLAYVKDHWVPFLVGTVLVAVTGAIVAVCLGKNADEIDGEGTDESYVDSEATEEEVEI